MFTSSELSRYSRNILLIGKENQEKLKNSIVSVVGAGGLGSPVLCYLAAAGVGEIRIADSDSVDITNLQRQILYNTNSIKKSKSDRAKEKLENLNPNLKIISFPHRLNRDNIYTFIENSNVVIEGSDNFGTKFLTHDACYFKKIPWIIGGILRFDGQVISGVPDRDACYRCIFNSPPPDGKIPTCSEAGVLGSLAGIIDSIQATVAIQFLIQIDQIGHVMSFDSINMELRKRKVKKNIHCPICGEVKLITGLTDISTDPICTL